MTNNINMYGWIEPYLRQIAGKHAPNLPDCITCIYAQVHLQPDVIATEIKDPTKTNKIGNGKGVIELQARVINYRSATREFHYGSTGNKMPGTFPGTKIFQKIGNGREPRT